MASASGAANFWLNPVLQEQTISDNSPENVAVGENTDNNCRSRKEMEMMGRIKSHHDILFGRLFPRQSADSYPKDSGIRKWPQKVRNVQMQKLGKITSNPKLAKCAENVMSAVSFEVYSSQGFFVRQAKPTNRIVAILGADAKTNPSIFFPEADTSSSFWVSA